MSVAVLAFLRSNWPALMLAGGIGCLVIWISVASYSRGVKDTVNQRNTAIVDQFEERNGNDALTRSMPDADLCRMLNGRLHNSRCE